MTEKRNTSHFKGKKTQLKSSLMGGEGISDVEERRHKLEEKKTYQTNITEEEREKYFQQIKDGFIIKITLKDIILFFVVQFLPLILLGSAFFIPGLLFFLTSNEDLRNLLLIIIILGSLIYLYSIIRFICAATYKLELSLTELTWRNIFWWNTIQNKDLTGINVFQSHYFYLTKLGGIIRFGIEVFQITSTNKEFWLRTYPLRKSRADELFKIISFWVELSESSSNN